MENSSKPCILSGLTQSALVIILAIVDWPDNALASHPKSIVLYVLGGTEARGGDRNDSSTNIFEGTKPSNYSN